MIFDKQNPQDFGMKKFESESDKSFRERFQRFLKARNKHTPPWRLSNDTQSKEKQR